MQTCKPNTSARILCSRREWNGKPFQENTKQKDIRQTCSSKLNFEKKNQGKKIYLHKKEKKTHTKIPKTFYPLFPLPPPSPLSPPRSPKKKKIKQKK
jgi:hypothetical protein